MTENEAIIEIKKLRPKGSIIPQKRAEMMDVAISALEKQIPKKPITYKGTNGADCSCCGARVRGIKEPWGNWCSKCGQKLDWSE